MHAGRIAAIVLLAASPALAREFLLQPGSTELAFRAYAMGLLPIDGVFQRFHGTLTLDPVDPMACRVVLEAEVSSLRMSDSSMTDEALGPDLLDAPTHPVFAYTGNCRGAELDGQLTLHGVTRRLALSTTRDKGRFAATGLMRRAEWGMAGRPMMAGPEVRISVTTALPP